MVTADGVRYNPNNKSLTYQLWSAQEEAYIEWVDGNNQIVDFRAGYRSGKSILGARAIVKQALKKENQRYLVMAESYAEGKKTTYRILFEQLPGFEDDDPETSPLVKKYSKKDKILTLINGTKIIFGTAEKWHKNKGDEFSGIWLDEFAFYKDSYKILEMLLSRLTADFGPRSILITTTTNGFNDYYDIVMEKIDKNGELLPWSIKSVQANSLNNPFLSKEAKENLKQTHGNNMAEGIEGEFSSAEGRVYDEFNRNNHVVDSADYNLQDKRFYAYDAGWNDKRVVLEIGLTSYNQFIILNEFYESESYVSDAIDWLKNKRKGLIVSEHEPEQMARFKKNLDGFGVKGANKSIDDGIDSVRERLKLDHDGRPGLLVDNSCTNTIKELLSYMKEDVGSSKAVDHACDCIRYFVHTSVTSNITSDTSRTNNVKNTNEAQSSINNNNISTSIDSVPSMNDVINNKNKHPFDNR